MRTRGHNYLGLWINFEGGDGVGKTTQQALLKEYLVGKGFVTHAAREPGGTEVGEEIRGIVLGESMRGVAKEDIPNLSSTTETLFFLAAGAQFFYQLTEPILKSGAIILTDR